jgi:hypothetical protein
MPFNTLSWDGVAYFRRMGRNAETWNNSARGDCTLYLYREEELQDFVQRLLRLNASKTFVVFHNDSKAFSLVHGSQGDHAIHPGKRLFVPPNLLSIFPQLKSFCKPLASDSLPFHTPEIKSGN